MDPIADFLTIIRNAYRARRPNARAPYSRVKENLAQILSRTGFLGAVKVEGQAPKKQLILDLVYQNRLPVLTHVSRLSRPSVRFYAKASSLRPTLSGRGLKIISTSKGLMTDKEARKLNLGGELVCQLW